MAGEQQPSKAPGGDRAMETTDALRGSSIHRGDTSAVPARAPVACDAHPAAASTTTLGSKSAADFFLDQIAAVVSDEKKLSDNIMDLIPPVESPTRPVDTGTQALSARVTSTSSLGIPLQLPPGLMMRALSPPTSLLPDFGDVASLSLLGDATASETVTRSDAIATLTTVTTPVKRELESMKTGSTSTVAAMTRSAECVTASGAAHKKQKMDNAKPELVVKEAAASVPVSVLQQQQGRHHLHSNTNSLPSSAAAAAREKVMKEPQSGDLYECVITKRNGGLGLTLACVDDHVQITGLAPDTPAANSGICVGDTLVAVSGLPVRGLQFSTVIGRLKSTSRNSVVLKLRRNPFRQTTGTSASYHVLKRPGRGVIKGSESSNSANVLSSKSMALETRMGGGLGNDQNGSAGDLGSLLNKGSTNAGLDDLHRSHHRGVAGFTNHATGSYHAQGLQVQVQSEPINSTYFPTDASILTMGARAPGSSSFNAVPPSTFAPSSSVSSDSQDGWRVSLEEKDRYYAECRALRHELGRSMVAQRIQKRNTVTYTAQLQAVVDKFQEKVRSLEYTSSAAAPASAIEASSVSSTTTNRDEVAALRQKLVEANQTLAQQQAEILALQEREARHAFPEAQRVKGLLVSNMRESLLHIDCKVASKWPCTPSEKTIGISSSPTLNFEKRFDGVRPCAFALLVGRSSVKAESPTVELELSVEVCTELLGWNCREVVVQAAGTYTVSVADSVHVKYVQTEEALVASWTLCVKDDSNNRK